MMDSDPMGKCTSAAFGASVALALCIVGGAPALGQSADSIFTEIRSEVGLTVGKTWDRTRATVSYKYSAESDYWSHAWWASLSQTFWGNTATVGAAHDLVRQAVPRLERHGRAGPPGGRALELDGVDCHNAGRARQRRGLDRRLADTTAPDDGDRHTGLHLRRVDDSADAGHYPAADERELLRGQVRPHGDHR